MRSEMDSRNEVITNIILALFGIGYLIYNSLYPLGTLANPGPAVFPLVIGMLMVALVALQLYQLVGKPKIERQGVEKKSVTFSQVMKKERKPFLAVIVLIIYLVVLNWIGFLTSTFVLVVISSKLMGARDWVRPIGLGFGVMLFCYFLFEVWLKLSLPTGFLI
jgi:putative tricarboxylic transport membrane protein